MTESTAGHTPHDETEVSAEHQSSDRSASIFYVAAEMWVHYTEFPPEDANERIVGVDGGMGYIDHRGKLGSQLFARILDETGHVPTGIHPTVTDTDEDVTRVWFSPVTEVDGIEEVDGL